MSPSIEPPPRPSILPATWNGTPFNCGCGAKCFAYYEDLSHLNPPPTTDLKHCDESPLRHVPGRIISRWVRQGDGWAEL